MKSTLSALDLGVRLTTGHQSKKRVEKDRAQLDAVGFRNVCAYGIAQLVDLTALSSDPFASFITTPLPSDLIRDVLLLSSNTRTERETRQDIFIFRHGVIVLWNTPEAEHQPILDRVRQFSRGILAEPLIEREDLTFCWSKRNTCLVGEDIYLQREDCRLPKDETNSADSTLAFNSSSDSDNPRLIPVEDPILLEQFAFSDALSLSVKLSLMENSFDSVAVPIEPWIESMKTGLRRDFPQSAVLKKTGELFTLRHLLNISSSMIETSDCYWDRPKVESLHTQLRAALSVYPRTKILNSKLDMCCELTSILSNHLQSRHSSRLEWMIIALILVEVAFEAFYYYERRLEKRNEAAFSVTSEANR